MCPSLASSAGLSGIHIFSCVNYPDTGQRTLPNIYTRANTHAHARARARTHTHKHFAHVYAWSRDSSVGTAPGSSSKGCEFYSRQELRRENFLLLGYLSVLTFIRCLFHPRVTAVTRKRPRSFFQKCRWPVTSKHAYTLNPKKSKWADSAIQSYQAERAHTQLAMECTATILSAR